MTNDDSYNGWTNRETWALNLYLNNDQSLYEMTRERVRETLSELDPEFKNKPVATWRAGEAVQDLWEELTEPSEGLLSIETILAMMRDVGSEYRVNWDEIGQYWLSDLDES